MTLFIVSLLLLLFLSAFFSASETSLFSLSSLKIKAYKTDPHPRRRLVSDLLASPSDLLVTIIMLNIATNILIQNVCASIFAETSSWMVNVGIPLVLTLIIGDILPKSIGLVSGVKIAERVAPIIFIFQKLLKPLRQIVVWITNGVSRFVFFFLHQEKEISIDELRHALRQSREYGVLQAEEGELIRGYLTLQESTVKEQMRPREEVLHFELEEPLSRLVHFFVDLECSRIPVCRKGLDQIIGIMTSKQFFLHQESIHKAEDLLTVIEKPFFVPETIPARLLLRQFYSRQESFAIVVDEYRSVSGIIALEDLVETVIGEIADRRDEKNLYTVSGKDVIIASGKMELNDLEELFDQPFPSENHMVTVGGYLTGKMGDIPKSGSKMVLENCLFHVLAADPTRVRRIYIRRMHTKR
ncbi:hemolysin family protein [Rhabdochlamydiaceae symbiont of Dictyostelium giganteum]|uniref:hemolysin family protein n=1 Tax=Rhabdochlamydiaceae symbiont of Dictyostelium giganteum TaxID=3342349 RepID=UPI00384EB93F